MAATHITMPASETQSDEVLNQDHLKFILESWTVSKTGGNRAVGKLPKTPEALRNMYQLLNDDGVPMYSV